MLCAFAAAFVPFAGAQPTSALEGYALVALDGASAVAIVRAPDGRLEALHAGERNRDRTFKLTHVYGDRAEIETPGRPPARHWLSLASPGRASALVPLGTEPPAQELSASQHITIETVR